MDITEILKEASVFSKMFEKKQSNLDSDTGLGNCGINPIKTILPYIDAKNKDQIYQIINFMEINSLITDYKKTSQNTNSNDLLKLKVQTISQIKNNIGDKNRNLVDVLVKAIELNNTMSNYKKE